MAHRTGKPGGPGPRPIIVRFHSRMLRSRVLADRRKLKKTGRAFHQYRQFFLSACQPTSVISKSGICKVDRIANGQIISPHYEVSS
ncbi:hypothetical protein ACOMHN_006526 [Nucella lapillus]